MKKYGKPIAMLALITSLLLGFNSISVAFAEEEEPEHIVTEPTIINIEYIPVEETEPPEPEYPLTDSEIEFIATVTMAEAENQSEKCKRLVIDTILNRLDSSEFPDTVHDVIYAKNQFEVMVNGRYERCYAKKSIIKLVKEELLDRTNTQVVYFNSIGYNNWSQPILQDGAMYFSGSKC